MGDAVERARQLQEAREKAAAARDELAKLENQEADAKTAEKQRKKDREKLQFELVRVSKEEAALVARRILLDEEIAKTREQKAQMEEQLRSMMLMEAGISASGSGTAGFVSGAAGAAAGSPTAAVPSRPNAEAGLGGLDLFQDSVPASAPQISGAAAAPSAGLGDLLCLDAFSAGPPPPSSVACPTQAPMACGLEALQGALHAAPGAAISSSYTGAMAGAAAASGSSSTAGAVPFPPGYGAPQSQQSLQQQHLQQVMQQQYGQQPGGMQPGLQPGMLPGMQMGMLPGMQPGMQQGMQPQMWQQPGMQQGIMQPGLPSQQGLQQQHTAPPGGDDFDKLLMGQLGR